MTEARSNFNDLMVPGLFAVATEGYRKVIQGWRPAYSVRASKRAYEESTYVSGFGLMVQKPEGTPVAYDDRIQGPVKRWVHETYALAVRITEECIEDEMYGVMKKAMRDLGKTAAATKAVLRSRLLMTGETPAFHTAGDGLPIFSANHVRLGGGTWSNLHPVAADPTEATLTAAIHNFEQITDHRGKRYQNRAVGIMCGPKWEFRFEKLLGSRQEPDTANNAINAVRSRRSLTLHIDPEITDGRWFILGEKDPDIGIIGFDRVRPQTNRHGDFDTGDSMFSIRMRLSQEANDPRQIYMVEGL